jgi:catechol 2,3-dioxygenase-like lactoylglutathione lyase family enzyme
MTHSDQRIRFHLSLNVASLARSVEFFRVLFGMEPAKLRPDYAKFEPDDPPLVLSLEPTARPTGGPLNHLGFRMPTVAALVAMQERLERSGIRSQREDGVECCYAKQTKFWVHDPDGTLWEVYTFEGDLDHRGAGQTQEQVFAEAAPASRPVIWEHRMGDPIPDRLPLHEGEADEVRLRGTFNLPLAAEKRLALVGEARRVLKPGGRLFVHVLSGEAPVESPQLPGPAGSVRYVPHETDPVRALESAGFVDLRMLKFDANPCFVRNEVAMRELQLEGWKRRSAGEATAEVMYKGPFRQVTDDEGRSFSRGRRLRVPASVAQRLQAGEWAGAFVIFSPAAESTMSSCGSGK